MLKTSHKLHILKSVFLSVFLVWTSLVASQTNAIDEENHTKAIFHIRKNTDSIHFYINKMKQSKNQCRVLFALLFEANTFYNKHEYESCTKILDSIIFEIDNNPKPNTFIYSEALVGKNYQQAINVIKLNVYRRFFFLRKNENKLIEAYDYLLLMQNIIDGFPKNDIYYLKNKISITYSMASLKRLLNKVEESLDILLKVNKEIDSIHILKNNIWYDNFQKEKANINVLIGYNYMHLEKYDLTEFYYDKAYMATQAIDTLNDKNKVADYFRKAELNYYRKNYNKALNFANKTSSYYNKDFYPPLYSIKAKIHSKLKNYDSAIYFSNKLVYRKNIDLIHESSQIHSVLAENYFALNKIDSAYKYSQLSLKANNKLNLEKSQTLDVLNESQLSEAVSLNKSIDKKRKSLKNKLQITIGLAILLFIAIFFYVFRKRKFFNQKIETFKKQLEESQKSQESNISKKENINTIDDTTTTRILADLTNIENSTIFLDKDFSLSVLAKLLNTNTSYLSRIINDHKQKTFKQYLIDLRINVLIKNLEENTTIRKYSIEALAESIGYTNASSFTRIFKNHVGVSPSIYLKEKYPDL